MNATGDVSQGSDATPLWLPQIALALGCLGLLLGFAEAMLVRAGGGVFFHKGGDEAAHAE